MGTKLNPGRYDCHANALPDEEMFVLLARDPDFERLVRSWAANRQRRIFCGDCPDQDHKLVEEALECAFAGARWRKENLGKWREPRPAAPPHPAVAAILFAVEKIDDHFDRLSFLQGWVHGDTAAWPEFKP